MDKILALFLIGLAVGILVPLAENFYQLSELLDEPITTIEHIFVAGSRFWQLAISILVLISLPAAIFKRISAHLSKKQFLPIPFMTGISFGYTFMAMLGLLGSAL